MSSLTIKPVKSQNLCKSVVQTDYDIVKAHGGEINMESEIARGTTFILTIPTSS